jgi:hypothetical protein
VVAVHIQTGCSHSMAEPLLDVAAQRQVQTLVKRITDKRAFSLEPGLLRDVKGLCRADDANVRAAFDAISEALQATHAQVTFALAGRRSTRTLLRHDTLLQCIAAVYTAQAPLCWGRARNACRHTRSCRGRLCKGHPSLHDVHYTTSGHTDDD